MLSGPSNGKRARSDSSSPIGTPADVQRITSGRYGMRSRPSIANRLPIQILVHIFNHVSFPDLFGTVQHVNTTWRFVAAHLILGNAIFLRRLLKTDFRNFLQQGNDEKDSLDTRTSSVVQDDTWQGVAIDKQSIQDFPALAHPDWRGSVDGEKFFLQVQELIGQEDLPYLVRGTLFTYEEQLELSDKQYNTLHKISIDQARPVLLDVVGFEEDEGSIIIDLNECYRVIYAEYRGLLAEQKALVELLEADLWSEWCTRNGKFWGKKRLGEHIEGMFIDKVDECNEVCKALDKGLRTVLVRFALRRRSTANFERMSLHNLTQDRSLRFEGSIKHPPTSRTTVEEGADLDEGSELHSPDEVHSSIDLRKTIESMATDFQWSKPGGLAEDILDRKTYESMYSKWMHETLMKWKITKVTNEKH